MDKNIAIKVENLTKIYHLYEKPQDRLKEALNPFKKSYHDDFYALNNVNFIVNKGDRVGVLGKNGAGKSTLLKIITGVLNPSSGTVVVDGTIGSLLELGAGFNPELTGLENIYLNGTLTGLSKEQVDLRVQDIIEFADIGEFIKQPVKKYSSGMFARLAFAVTINIDPDILIVDEALAVGDISFQSKCIARMKAMTDRGVTLLFVSHDTYSVQSLCDKAILIDDGKITQYGDVEHVTSAYLEVQRNENNELLASYEIKKQDEHEKPVTHIPHSLDLSGKKVLQGKVSGNNKATLLDFALLDQNGVQADEIESNQEYILKLAVRFNQDLPTFAVICPIRSLNGVQEIGVSSSVEQYSFPPAKKGEIYIIEMRSVMNLQYGAYNLVIAIEIPIEQNKLHEFAYVLENCLTFKVNWGELKFPTKFYTRGEISYSLVD